MGSDAPATVDVAVFDTNGELLTSANVEILVEGRKKPAKARFHRTLGVARARPAGRQGARARVQVSSPGRETQRREVTLQPGGIRETFVLGAKGLPYYMRGEVKVPFERPPGMIGVRLQRRPQQRDVRDELDAFADEMGLERMETSAAIEAEGVTLFRLRKPSMARERDALARLYEHPAVESAGIVVSVRENSFTFATDELVVKFQPEISDEDAREALHKEEVEIIRSLPYSANTYHVRVRDPGTSRVLDVAARLNDRDDVVWAEPNLVSVSEPDAVNPTDYLWPGVWDRLLVNTPGAWQALQDAGLETFGSPDVIIATVDHGLQSAGGMPSHPDFQGTVSNGAAKVYRLQDFVAMVPNNDNPLSNHGMGVAGVSTALAGNASIVPGQTEGLAGAAPNCRVMGIICSSAMSDVQIADMYIWTAGFDPQSPVAGFPMAISPGADVFTCSIPFGAGAPLAGTAKAMLDFVTTYGRGGKGCLCFFSTGNAGFEITTNRPYANYEKSFGIGATRFQDDGITEERAPSSGFGNLALSAPSNDQWPIVHNPPTRFGTWGADLVGQGNLIGAPSAATTLTANAAMGATTITVASVAGFAVNSRVLLGTPGAAGSEVTQVTGPPNPATNQLPVMALLNAHPNGTAVATGAADYTNAFGGTSSATPLAAGVAALVLSAEPDLTWIEARQILRDTAIKVDPTNTNATGQWLDANGNPSVTSGNPPVFSKWFGFGRVDAEAAVQEAVSFGFTRDLIMRDNLADVGTVAATGAFWNTPDVWVRNVDPAVEGAAALPASYAAAGPHLSPIAGQDNWVYMRVKNIGTADSLDAYIRVSISHWPGPEFVYPEDFIPDVRPGDPLPSPLQLGTYLIGEVKVTAIAPGDDEIVNVKWPVGLIPPETVMVGPTSVHWHPCLLAEISPHDGPTPTGDHVWDDNNLAQKNISIVFADIADGVDFAVGAVVGHEENDEKFIVLEVDRGTLPRQVTLYVDLVHPKLKRRLRQVMGEHENGGEREAFHPGLFLDPIREGGRLVVREEGTVLVAAPAATTLETTATRRLGLRKPYAFSLAMHDGREVAVMPHKGKGVIPIFAGPGMLTPIVVGGFTDADVPAGTYSITLVQRSPNGAQQGGCELSVTLE